MEQRKKGEQNHDLNSLSSENDNTIQENVEKNDNVIMLSPYGDPSDSSASNSTTHTTPVVLTSPLYGSWFSSSLHDFREGCTLPPISNNTFRPLCDDSKRQSCTLPPITFISDEPSCLLRDDSTQSRSLSSATFNLNNSSQLFCDYSE